MSHNCAATTPRIIFVCDTVIEDQFLFCPKHWRMIPEELKKTLGPRKTGSFEAPEAEKTLYESALTTALTFIQEKQMARITPKHDKPLVPEVEHPGMGPLR